MAMFLLAYHVSIDEHRSVQYVIEQYGENNKQSIGMYIQLHQTSALKPEKLHSKQQNIGGANCAVFAKLQLHKYHVKLQSCQLSSASPPIRYTNF